MILYSRQKQFYFFARARHFSPAKTVFLLIDGSCCIILNLALLKVALFEEYIICLFCAEYLKLFKTNYIRLEKVIQQQQNSTNYGLLQDNKKNVSATVLAVFIKHYAYVQWISFINRLKISKVMFAYMVTFLPLNIYLLQSVIFKKADSISINFKMTAILQTIIMFTASLPMCTIYATIRRPAQYMNALQMGVSAEQIKLKGKIANFYEYLTDDFPGKGFSLGSIASIKSANLLKVIN